MVVFFNHFRAILYRRYMLAKRGWRSIVVSIAMTLIFSLLAILIQYLMKTLVQEKRDPITFKSFVTKSDDIYIVKDKSAEKWSEPLIDILQEVYKNDTGRDALITIFNDRDSLNNKMLYDNTHHTGPNYIKMGVWFDKLSPINIPPFINNSEGYEIVLFYNGTLGSMHKFETDIQLTRVLWKNNHGKDSDFKFTYVELLKKVMELIFGILAPMLVVCGVISVLPVIISQPIVDLSGEVRDYMQSMSLTLVPYWLATFVIDIVLWVVICFFTWLIFVIFQIRSFMDNMTNTLYCLFTMGPSFILYTYCMSFMFKNAESASRNAYIINTLILLVPMILSFVWDDYKTPIPAEWIYSLFPHIALQRELTSMMSHISFLKQDLSFYWKEKSVQPEMIMTYLDIVLYFIVLMVIEKLRVVLRDWSTRKSFSSYTSLFYELKQHHPHTEETQRMEEEVDSSHDYAVRISHLSRLFFSTTNEPIAAVNDVSLGVKRGSIFGFLGANGAGKTTLIRMITSIIPPSFGSIEVNGMDITATHDKTQIAICPQFNTHLCFEMTPIEHFKLYADIFCYSKTQALDKQNQLMRILEIEQYKDKPVREMSGGQQRRLAVAISFFGPANIILLDEPTSSLDPYARHTVHELITLFKGQKTFMLCTHMLNEAEALCDTISIMVRGNVYTVGSPQYLSTKFGTEYKVEILLPEGDEAVSQRTDEFFAQQLSMASLTIKRPNARIYSIPADAISLCDLFTKMEEGRTGGAGYTYYTCASSSLERVFLEIVRMSESSEQYNEI